MTTKKFAVLLAAFLFMAGFAIQPAFADHNGHKPCPMMKEMSECKGKQGKCPMKTGRSQSMERTAGSVPVYGAKKGGCCKKASEKPCCKDKAKPHKCPMKHDGKKADMKHEAHHQGHHAGGHGGHTSADMTYGGAEAKALDAAMAKMHRDMAVPATGDADADFIRGMIPHHQGAIDMARIVLEHGDDPAAQKLARNIIRAQKGEIAWMQRWLRERQLPQTGAIDLRK